MFKTLAVLLLFTSSVFGQISSIPAAAGGGGSGSSTTYGLTDLKVTATGTTMTIGSSCSVSSPCNVRFGNTVYSFTSSASATIASGTGTVYVYITSGGVLTVGYNAAPVPSCTSCTATSGVTAFPADSIPLSTWTASSGVWDAESPAFDKRAMMSTKPIAAGSNITISSSSGVDTISATGGLGYSLDYSAALFAGPADATAYCLGRNGASSWDFACSSGATYWDGFKIQIPTAGTITAFTMTAWYGLGVAASNENITVALCISTANGEGSCTNIATTVQWTATTATYTRVGSLSIAVAAGDRVIIKLTTPTWGTNPTNVTLAGSLYIQ